MPITYIQEGEVGRSAAVQSRLGYNEVESKLDWGTR